MQYLDIILKIVSAISALASAISNAEDSALPALKTLWADVQAIYAAVESAFSSGSQLSDDQLASVDATLDRVRVAVDGTDANKVGIERVQENQKAEDEKSE